MTRDLENIVSSLSSGPLWPCALHSALLSREQGSANYGSWAKSGWPSVFVRSFIGTHPHAFTYVLSVAAFTLQYQSWIVMIVTIQSTKHKIFTSRPFTEKLCWALPQKMEAMCSPSQSHPPASWGLPNLFPWPWPHPESWDNSAHPFLLGCPASTSNSISIELKLNSSFRPKPFPLSNSHQ